MIQIHRLSIQNLLISTVKFNGRMVVCSRKNVINCVFERSVVDTEATLMDEKEN